MMRLAANTNQQSFSIGTWIMQHLHADGRQNRRQIIAGLGATLGLPIFGAAPAISQTLSTLTLGWVKSTTNLAAFASPALASKNGLKIESVNLSTAVDIATAMVSGD